MTKRSFCLLSTLLLTIVLFPSCNKGDSTSFCDSIVTTEIIGPPAPPKARTSVTFIMGNDHEYFNQYYDMASHYYRINSNDRTDILIDNLTSLSQVLEWLNSHPAADSLPYGLVNLVSHGNEFIDLQMKIVPGGSRTSPDAIQQALADALLKVPDSTIIDSHTTVFLHGCAVGNNQKLLDGLAEAFGNRATVMASKLFEYYAYLSPNRNPQSIEHYYARTWYAYYHPDSAYNESSIIRQLRHRYPHDTTHWLEGLHRRFQNDPSQIYHYSFIVPCSYSTIYENPSEIPSVNSKSKRQQWINANTDFKEMLEITHIPMQFFQTKFYRQTAVGDDDKIYYGLKVKARAGVICLIQPLLQTDMENTVSEQDDTHDSSPSAKIAPFRPLFTDTTIFAFSRHQFSCATK